MLLERANREVDQASARRRWTIPARYGDEHGPDLAYVSEAMGLSDEAAIQAHASLRLRVLMLGFAPGLAYLGIAGEPWDIPRRPEVRPHVPPGSILVAVRQTVLAGTAIPTGWQHIAHTPVPTFQPEAADPFRFDPGDIVSFEPVSAEEHASLSQQADAGSLTITPATDDR